MFQPVGVMWPMAYQTLTSKISIPNDLKAIWPLMSRVQPNNDPGDSDHDQMSRLQVKVKCRKIAKNLKLRYHNLSSYFIQGHHKNVKKMKQLAISQMLVHPQTS